VYINDVNDNAPVFSQSSYAFSIAESTPVDMNVWEPLGPKVTDLDKNENSHIFFSVIPDDVTGAVKSTFNLTRAYFRDSILVIS